MDIVTMRTSIIYGLYRLLFDIGGVGKKQLRPTYSLDPTNNTPECL